MQQGHVTGFLELVKGILSRGIVIFFVVGF
jgi:hypothetical protein